MLTIYGVYTYGTEARTGRRTFDLVTERLADSRLDLSSLITHRFQLAEFARAIQTTIQRPQHRSVKVVFDNRRISA